MGRMRTKRANAVRRPAGLLGREPKREVAGIVLDKEADETFVRAERG